MASISLLISDDCGGELCRLGIASTAAPFFLGGMAASQELRNVVESACHAAEFAADGKKIQVCPLGSFPCSVGVVFTLAIRVVALSTGATTRKAEPSLPATARGPACPGNGIEHLFEVEDLNGGGDGDDLFL